MLNLGNDRKRNTFPFVPRRSSAPPPMRGDNFIEPTESLSQLNSWIDRYNELVSTGAAFATSFDPETGSWTLFATPVYQPTNVAGAVVEKVILDDLSLFDDLMAAKDENPMILLLSWFIWGNHREPIDGETLALRREIAHSIPAVFGWAMNPDFERLARQPLASYLYDLPVHQADDLINFWVYNTQVQFYDVFTAFLTAHKPSVETHKFFVRNMIFAIRLAAYQALQNRIDRWIKSNPEDLDLVVPLVPRSELSRSVPRTQKPDPKTGFLTKEEIRAHREAMDKLA